MVGLPTSTLPSRRLQRLGFNSFNLNFRLLVYMGRLITGSICYTDLVAAAKNGHSAFSRSEKNGKVYFNVAIWQKEEPDKYGNDFSIQLNAKKDSTEEKVLSDRLNIWLRKNRRGKRQWLRREMMTMIFLFNPAGR